MNKKKSRKNIQLLVLAFLLGSGLFTYGWYTEQKQENAYKQRQLEYAETKLAELLPQLNTLHHQRVQYVIDEYPDLKNKPELQKQLMEQMDMNIESKDDLKKILAAPLESVTPGFSLSGFSKEQQWSSLLISASSFLTTLSTGN